MALQGGRATIRPSWRVEIVPTASRPARPGGGSLAAVSSTGGGGIRPWPRGGNWNCRNRRWPLPASRCRRNRTCCRNTANRQVPQAPDKQIALDIKRARPHPKAPRRPPAAAIAKPIVIVMAGVPDQGEIGRQQGRACSRNPSNT